jgi:hypothetical protein
MFMSTLKDCLYATIHKNHKPLKAIAEELGMSENYLTRSALPDPEESETGSGCRFPLKKLISLIRTTGDFSVLDYIEQSLGRVAIKAPQPAGCKSEIYKLVMMSVKEFGELMGDLDASLADGRLTEDEIQHVKNEGYDAMQAIATLLNGMETGNLK